MLESGSSGSVRGVLSNEHPYREPGPGADLGLFQRGMRFQVDALCRLSRFLDHNPLGDTYLADAGFLDFLRPLLRH
jgi:hypothetical protein